MGEEVAVRVRTREELRRLVLAWVDDKHDEPFPDFLERLALDRRTLECHPSYITHPYPLSDWLVVEAKVIGMFGRVTWSLEFGCEPPRLWIVGMCSQSVEYGRRALDALYEWIYSQDVEVRVTVEYVGQ
jgi:hypothetical protein